MDSINRFNPLERKTLTDVNWMTSTISSLSLSLSLPSLKHSTYFQIAVVLTNTLWAVYIPNLEFSIHILIQTVFIWLISTSMRVSLKIQFCNNHWIRRFYWCLTQWGSSLLCDCWFHENKVFSKLSLQIFFWFGGGGVEIIHFFTRSLPSILSRCPNQDCVTPLINQSFPTTIGALFHTFLIIIFLHKPRHSQKIFMNIYITHIQI